MAHKKQIPCYLPNGGVHNVINIPMGIFMRAELRKLCRELLKHWEQLETFVAAEATPRTLTLLRGLSEILSVDLKPQENRKRGKRLLAVNEKNLKLSAAMNGTEDSFNLVTFAISCGLIAFIFLLAAHLEYLEALN